MQIFQNKWQKKEITNKKEAPITRGLFFIKLKLFNRVYFVANTRFSKTSNTYTNGVI
jgi:hypothetical protein